MRGGTACKDNRRRLSLLPFPDSENRQLSNIEQECKKYILYTFKRNLQSAVLTFEVER